jgi:hypothetical protein
MNRTCFSSFGEYARILAVGVGIDPGMMESTKETRFFFCHGWILSCQLTALTNEQEEFHARSSIASAA